MRKFFCILGSLIFILFLQSKTVMAAQYYVVVTSNDTTLTIEGEPTDSIEAIKGKLQEKVEIPPEQQFIRFRGIVLDEGKMLSDYNILPGSTLYLDLRHEHSYKNGICQCGAYEPAKLTTDVYDLDEQEGKDAVYEISNAGQLYWFAEYVNRKIQIAGADTTEDTTDDVYATSANAVLTADITVNENLLTELITVKQEDGSAIINSDKTVQSWTPIGNADNDYKGKFDGQNHTISGLYFNDDNTGYVGLFGYAGAEIKNVGVIDSYFCGSYDVGGVCGYSYGTVINCNNTGSVNGKSLYVGGVCGYSYGTVNKC